MESLKITKVVDKQTSKGDPYKVVDVMKSDGTTVTGVSAFKFKFPNLDTLVEGATITAGVVLDGNYKNLVGAIEKPRTGQNQAFKQKVIEESMQRKEQSISKFQTNKEEAIALMSAQRDAVLIVTNFYREAFEMGTGYDEAIQKEIVIWRNWFLSDDFTEHPPF